MRSRRPSPYLVSSSIILLALATLPACAHSAPGGAGVFGPYSSALFRQAPGHWPDAVPAVGPGTSASPLQPCDMLDSAECLLPFPDDYYTAPDPATATGIRLSFPGNAMPANAAGVLDNPIDLSSSDGFSPGSQILVHVPGLDPARSKVAPVTDIGASLSPDSPVVLLDTRTGRQWPTWGSLDVNNPDPATQLFIVNPAVELAEGDSYVVALRNLRSSSGAPIPPPPSFSSALSGRPVGGQETVRAAHLKAVVSVLGRAGISTRGLYLAWDFTVASASSIAGPLLHMRDSALATLGSKAPSFTVTSVQDLTPQQNPYVARYVSGTFDVPSFLDRPGGPPGSTFHLGDDGMPAQIPGNLQRADFVCEIPRSADAAPGDPGAVVHPARPALYGHGLFGTAAEVRDLGATATAGNFVFCGTDWIGMSSADLGNAYAVLQDFSTFPSIPDRLDQGILDFIYLGRLLTRPDGFDASPAFQSGAPGHPGLVATGVPLSYYGNSQGSVVGGALVAVSPDLRRAVLGVPGMNFSLLMARSSDFAVFNAIFHHSYPDPTQEVILEGLAQILWDRGETDGYVDTMTAHPLPGTPSHTILLQAVLGDHQVSNYSTEIEARTLGARTHRPVFASGRSPESIQLWGIPGISTYPYRGSALFFWDNGTAPPPASDTPDSAGNDPHDLVPRKLPAAQRQLVTFLLTGGVVNPCGTGACRSPANPTTAE